MDGSSFGGSLIRLDQGSSHRDQVDDGITARLATTPEVFAEAWSVRHAGYLAQGLIDSMPDSLFADEWDFRPTTKVIVIYKNYVPVATGRVCQYAPGGDIAGADAVPAMDVFHDEIVGIFRQYSDSHKSPRGAEVGRLARHPDLGADYEPVFALFRMVGYLLLEMEADAVISAVQKHHAPFYRRLGFERLTGPSAYPKLKMEVGFSLMACMRKPAQELQDSLPVLRVVSKADRAYGEFLRGERVPGFGTCSVPAGLTGMLGNRFKDNQTARAALAAQATGQDRPDAVQLGA